MVVDLSVIIPVHNAAKIISRTVKRILKQKNINYEVILVENNSTDDSYNICNKLSNNYSNVFTIQTKLRGTNRARWVGVQNSKGRWVTFMDQDDLLTSNNAYYKMISKIEIENEKIAIAQFGNYRGYKGLPLKRRFQTETEGPIKIDLSGDTFAGLFCWQKNPIVTTNVWSKIYCGDLIRKALRNSDYELYYCEDMETNFQIFKAAQFKYFISYSDSFYCWNLGGTSSNKEALYKLLKEYSIIRPEIENYLTKNSNTNLISKLHTDLVYFYKEYLVKEGLSCQAEELFQTDYFNKVRSVEKNSGIADKTIYEFSLSTSANEFYQRILEGD